MADIYSAVDLSSFQFTTRCNPFNWRLLHGLDVDVLVSSVGSAATAAANRPPLLLCAVNLGCRC